MRLGSLFLFPQHYPQQMNGFSVNLSQQSQVQTTQKILSGALLNFLFLEEQQP
jgi:hypothetical protein